MMDMLADLPLNHFRTILADPPWRFKSNSVAKPGRNAMRHYPTMSLQEIEDMPVARHAAKDSALFFWITGPFFVRGAHLPIMRAWGYEPTAIGFVWTKLRPKASSLFFFPDDAAMGGGHTTRKCTEYCILGKRGRSVRKSAKVKESVITPRRRHSEKPVEVHERIEAYCDGPYLELFGRRSRPGWEVRGNQATLFDEAAAA